MKERILMFLQSENKTSAQFAEEIGVQPSGISHIISGRNKPSLDFVIKMLEKYPFISSEWLLFGKGSMYRDGNLQTIFDGITPGNADPGLQQEKSSKTDDNEIIIRQRETKTEGADVERIVWFFSDNSFREYKPGND